MLTPVFEGAIRTPDQRLRVFISSTLGELAEERLAARATVERLRLTPVMFELGARPHPPRALYRSYLAQSDVFVGIYWQSHGWVAPDMEISGLEDELDLSGEMPRLLYVKRPAPDIHPRLAEMLGRLESEDTASYKPFADAEELQGLLLDDLAILLAERFDGGRPASTSAPSPRSNLPTPTSTFLGREAEIEDLCAMVSDKDVRLITLTGPGGIGKSRLALQVADREAGSFADGVHFVDLSAEREVDGTFAAVARAVGVPVASEVHPLDALRQALRDRQVLLLLDSFEQVIGAAVDLVLLLEHCPAVNVLITSREALRARGERIVAVPPLSLPEGTDMTSVGGAEAVRLFCDRAGSVRSGFRLDEGNAAAIASICCDLDGLPLAIELAAARVQLFDVEDLRARLEVQLDVLRGGPRDLPPRQQTLRDAIAWSHDLLTADERLVFAFATVFSDACLVDVEQTARRVPALLDVDVITALGSLVDKSLVRSSPGADGRPRFSMLQTIRAYATEERDRVPELTDAVRLAHAEHYTEVALRLHQRLTFALRSDVLLALSAELGNLRAAWDTWVGRGDVARLNDLIAPLWGYDDARGDYRSAIGLGHDLLACLAETPDSADRRRDEFVVRMNVARTELAVRGFTAEAERLTRDALDRAEEGDDVRERFPGLRSLAYLHLMRSDVGRVAEIGSALMGIADQEQDPSLLAEAHLIAGLGHGWQGDLHRALEHYDRAIESFESTASGYVEFRVGPNPGVVALVVAALSRWIAGSADAASTDMQRALDLAADLDHPYSTAYAVQHAALLDLWRFDLPGAATRADELLAIADAHDYPTWRAIALVFKGLAMVASDDVDDGVQRVEEGVELYRGLAAPPLFWPHLLVMRSAALGMAGRAVEGLASIEQAEAAVLPGDPLGPDVAIVHAELHLLEDPPDVPSAVAQLERAATLAGHVGARMAHLRALTRLVVLRRATPGADDLVRELRELYGQFTEGFDSPHLVAARGALRIS